MHRSLQILELWEVNVPSALQATAAPKYQRMCLNLNPCCCGRPYITLSGERTVANLKRELLSFYFSVFSVKIHLETICTVSLLVVGVLKYVNLLSFNLIVKCVKHACSFMFLTPYHTDFFV